MLAAARPDQPAVDDASLAEGVLAAAVLDHAVVAVGDSGASAAAEVKLMIAVIGALSDGADDGDELAGAPRMSKGLAASDVVFAAGAAVAWLSTAWPEPVPGMRSARPKGLLCSAAATGCEGAARRGPPSVGGRGKAAVPSGPGGRGSDVAPPVEPSWAAGASVAWVSAATPSTLRTR